MSRFGDLISGKKAKPVVESKVVESKPEPVVESKVVESKPESTETTEKTTSENELEI